MEETENDRKVTAGEGRKAVLIAGVENREATGRKFRAIEAIVIIFGGCVSSLGGRKCEVWL